MSEDENREIESQSWSKLFNLASESKLENDSDIVGIMRIVLDILQDYDNELKVSSSIPSLRSSKMTVSFGPQISRISYFISPSQRQSMETLVSALQRSRKPIEHTQSMRSSREIEKILQADSLSQLSLTSSLLKI